MTHQRYFPARSDRVFAALIGALTSYGRVHGIEGRGTVVVFETQRSPIMMTRRLRARVEAHEDGTMLEVVEADHSFVSWTEQHDDTNRLMMLLDDVAIRVGDSDQVLRIHT